MAVNTIEERLNTAAYNLRGPSPVIWADCPVTAIKENFGIGMLVEDDFLLTGSADMGSIYKGSIGQWSVYGDAGALIGDAGLEGGVLTLDATTDAKSLVFSSFVTGYRILTTSTLALNQKLWFEASVGRSSVAADLMECFVGLCNGLVSSNLRVISRPITVTDDTLDITDCDFIGFHNKGSSGALAADWQFVWGLHGGTAIYSAGLTTLMATALGSANVAVANQLVKLGFLFDPNAVVKQVVTAGDLQTAGTQRKALIRIFVNGVELPTFITSDNMVATASHAFPTGFMAPTFAQGKQATSASTMLIDWIRVAQLGNS